MSTAEALLHDLAEYGVMVWQENGQLRYRAPSGVMTPDLIATMRHHKPCLLTLLAPRVCSKAQQTAKSIPFVLTFELDGGRVTCIDPISKTIEQSVASLRERFYDRVGRVWQQEVEVRIR